jgi:hypothetical protein
MEVVAVLLGIYRGNRVRPGKKFDMPELDGPNPCKMPRWVKPVGDAPVQVKTSEQAGIAAAFATAGPKRPGVDPVINPDGTKVVSPSFPSAKINTPNPPATENPDDIFG